MTIVCANSVTWCYVNMGYFMNVHGLVTSPVLTLNDIVSYKILASDIVTTVLCHIISCFLKRNFET